MMQSCGGVSCLEAAARLDSRIECSGLDWLYPD